ncbi:hypothetical protein IPZ58_27820 [Streptomyces roseoverticillatus]|uniref:hypothetical protein n=1 Tax=Streptomyces roseoverticillatus TaxID=66429 RepID=UPI001F23ACBF|nr:hypothetical protein [Streptomyces roseoverticillatus]MCF3105370.1 hypothetical protein [Streptomyces roseoverticillatus]
MTTSPTSPTSATEQPGDNHIRVDGPDGPVMVNVEAIEQRIAAGIRPVVDGGRIDPAEITKTIAGLVGDAKVLLPVAEARYKDHGGQVAMGLDSLRRRLAYHRPDPCLYPLNAALCAADLARSCRTLLSLVTEPVDSHRVVLTTW